MSAPVLTFSVSGNKISSVEGHDSISVTFSSDIPYKSFECRATKVGNAWGVGIGTLIASFSQTPANTERQFDIYDDYLLNGDGEYRITLLAQGEDGEWNTNMIVVPMLEFPFSSTEEPEIIMSAIVEE